MSDSKVFMLPGMQAGSNQLDPNLLMVLNQNGGFGDNEKLDVGIFSFLPLAANARLRFW